MLRTQTNQHTHTHTHPHTHSFTLYGAYNVRIKRSSNNGYKIRLQFEWLSKKHCLYFEIENDGDHLNCDAAIRNTFVANK